MRAQLPMRVPLRVPLRAPLRVHLRIPLRVPIRDTLGFRGLGFRVPLKGSYRGCFQGGYKGSCVVNYWDSGTIRFNFT